MKYYITILQYVHCIALQREKEAAAATVEVEPAAAAESALTAATTMHSISASNGEG